MAKRRRKSSTKKRKSSSTAKCKVIAIKGQGRRKICWGRNGKIKSNKKA